MQSFRLALLTCSSEGKLSISPHTLISRVHKSSFGVLSQVGNVQAVLALMPTYSKHPKLNTLAHTLSSRVRLGRLGVISQVRNERMPHSYSNLLQSSESKRQVSHPYYTCWRWRFWRICEFMKRRLASYSMPATISLKRSKPSVWYSTSGLF